MIAIVQSSTLAISGCVLVLCVTIPQLTIGVSLRRPLEWIIVDWPGPGIQELELGIAVVMDGVVPEHFMRFLAIVEEAPIELDAAGPVYIGRAKCIWCIDHSEDGL